MNGIAITTSVIAVLAMLGIMWAVAKRVMQDND